jgi:hypothetical protein
MTQPLTRPTLIARLELISGILAAETVSESYRITCAVRLLRRLRLELGGDVTTPLVPDRGCDRAVGGEPGRILDPAMGQADLFGPLERRFDRMIGHGEQQD